MKVHVSQIYIAVGVNFPFSCRWQVWLSEELSSLVTPSALFERKYGASFELMERRGLREALSLDHHFAQAGFILLV